jgi:hypothetical protein
MRPRTLVLLAFCLAGGAKAQTNGLPRVSIHAPRLTPNNSPNNYPRFLPLPALTEIAGTARPAAHGGRVKSVEVTLKAWLPNLPVQFWNGTAWAPHSYQARALVAKVVGETWAVTARLPLGAKLPTGNYMIEAAAYDAFDDAGYAQLSFSVAKQPVPTIAYPEPRALVAGIDRINGTVQTFDEKTPRQIQVWLSRQVSKPLLGTQVQSILGYEFVQSFFGETIRESWGGEKWDQGRAVEIPAHWRAATDKPGSWSWTCDIPPGLKNDAREGWYTVNAKVTDAGGDMTCESTSFTVTQWPLVSITEPAKPKEMDGFWKNAVPDIPVIRGTAKPIPGGLPLNGIEVLLSRRSGRQPNPRQKWGFSQDYWNGVAWLESPEGKWPADGSLATEYLPPAKAGDQGYWKVTSRLPPGDSLMDGDYIIYARGITGTAAPRTTFQRIRVYRGPKIQLRPVQTEIVNSAASIRHSITGTVQAGPSGAAIDKVFLTLMKSEAAGGNVFWNGKEWVAPPVRDARLEARLEPPADPGGQSVWVRDLDLPDVTDDKLENYTLSVYVTDSAGKNYGETFRFSVGAKN